ncbi:MAG: DUF1648 domain-containing protein [Bryobacteraceae bacterium]|nr:DUF1648 domain-containing protein [Bryobacteraceae bacterium]MDW8377187.1 DUF1648 domain-containing protein [Bryobacterales bacterium]
MSQPVRRSPVDWILEACALSLLVALFATTGIYWDDLPERVPTHFNAAGAPDAWGKKRSIWLYVGMGAALYGILSAVARFPHWVNLPFEVDKNSAEVQRILYRMIQALKIAVLGILFYILVATIQTASGEFHGLGAWFLPLALAATFLPLGFYLFQLYQQQRR